MHLCSQVTPLGSPPFLNFFHYIRLEKLDQIPNKLHLSWLALSGEIQILVRYVNFLIYSMWFIYILQVYNV